MVALQITLNVLIIGLIALLSAFVGYIFRSKQIISSRKKIVELEKEMLSSHAEILSLQQKIVAMEKRDASNIPVIPIKTSPDGNRATGKSTRTGI